ncbi:MAG: hypothetical protein QOF78_3214 [Phycisphaerales bacterium]|jgi:tetratricopeptide (TPR) repeat protein|nr:hypothetical protein [Phycisphaerales bacterium]
MTTPDVEIRGSRAVAYGDGARIEYHEHHAADSRPKRPLLLPPVLDQELVEVRQQLVREIREKLRPRAEPGSATPGVILCGLVGSGKTAVATALAHDPGLGSDYPDGTLWAAMGRNEESPQSREHNLEGLLHNWANALGAAIDRFTRLPSCEEKARELRSLIGDRRMLLLVDDVWDSAIGNRILACRGARCAFVVTTRQEWVAVNLPSAHKVEVKTLEPAQAESLVALVAPGLKEMLPDKKLLDELISKAGGLPMALTPIASLLHQESLRRGPAGAVALATEFLAQLSPEDVQSPGGRMVRKQRNEHGGSQVASVVKKMEASIEASTKLLDPELAESLWMLAAFPAKPHTFPAEAARSIADRPDDDFLRELRLLGIIEPMGQDRYAIHQAIADFAKRKQLAALRRARTALVRYFVERAQRHGDSDGIDGLAEDYPILLEAMRVGAEKELHAEVIQIANGCFAFIEARGSFLLKRTCELLRNGVFGGATKPLKHADAARALLNLSRVEEKEGRYNDAQKLLADALDRSARVTPRDRDLLACIHLNRGIIEFSRCDYAKAAQHLDDARREHEQSETADPRSQCEIQQWLANVALVIGNVDQATQCVIRARDAAKRIMPPDLERFCAVCLVEGAMFVARDEPYLASSALADGLSMADRLGHRQYIAALRHMMIVAEGGRDDISYPRVAEHLAHAEAAAREIEHRWYLSAVHCARGEDLLRQNRPEPAKAAFQDALDTSPPESRDRRAFAKFGLARAMYRCATTAACSGGEGAALERGQDALKDFTDIGHVAAKDVQFWLACVSMDVAEDAYRNRKLDEARKYFEFARAAAPVTRKDQTAFALYGLSRIAQAERSGELAQKLGQESLNLFEEIKFNKAQSVRKWVAFLASEQVASMVKTSELGVARSQDSVAPRV